jgi:hypothetical protein
MKDDSLVTDKNVVYAIFTSAQARLKLYNDFIEPLGSRVLYTAIQTVLSILGKKEKTKLTLVVI